MFTKFYTKSLIFLKIALVTVLVLTVFAACKKQAEEQTQGAVQKETVAAVAVEETGSAIIEADQLKKYIDNGYKTDDGKKVLILHVTLQNGTLPEITIKGAYPFSQEEYLMEKRSDGVAPNGAMVASGAKVDKFLSKYGVDKDTVIVLTSHDLTNQMIYRTFWALKYWGFTNDNLKVLNGANYYFFNQFAIPFEIRHDFTPYLIVIVRSIGNIVIAVVLFENITEFRVSYLVGSTRRYGVKFYGFFKCVRFHILSVWFDRICIAEINARSNDFLTFEMQIPHSCEYNSQNK